MLIYYNLALVNYAELCDYFDHDEQDAFDDMLDGTKNPELLEAINKKESEERLKKEEEK